MRKSSKDIIVIGFALFALFFGAGNLIFPPFLGNVTGSEYPLAVFGFILTGVGLPLLSILAIAKNGGDLLNLTDLVGKKFTKIFCTVLVICLGPVIVIPRTAATTFELGVVPIFGEISPIIPVIIFFAICLALIFLSSSIVDTIGKYLTPVLLIVLSVILLSGLINPIGEVGVATLDDNIFSYGFQEGYQTMDALGALLIGAIVVMSVREKGYTNKKELMSVTAKSGLIAIVGLAVIYSGLAVLGAQLSTEFPGTLGRSELVVLIAQSTLGSAGPLALGLCVSVACITTAVGFTTTIANTFVKLSDNKLSFKPMVLVITGISALLATLGVDSIVALAAPMLDVLYPVSMIFIFTAFILDKISRKTLSITVYTTLVVSVMDMLANSFGIGGALTASVNMLPLSSIGFAWVLPALIAFGISCVMFKGSIQVETATENI